jgi:antitoxin MazE
MPTSVKVREKFQVTIPETVRKQVPLEVGDRVEVVAKGNEIVIRPIVEVPKAQAWFWSKEWQEQVAQSINDLEKKKVKVFKSVKKAKEHFGD